MDTSDGWRERRELLLKKARVYTLLSELIADAKRNAASLAVFKPTKLTSFTFEEEEEREWSEQQIAEMRHHQDQNDLFADNSWRESFRLINKRPYAFSYTFEDSAGVSSTMKILDWEIGQLFWSCSRKDPEAVALQKVRQKYWDEFIQKDLHFFLGTTEQYHNRAPNPWTIIGVFPIPHEKPPENNAMSMKLITAPPWIDPPMFIWRSSGNMRTTA